MSAHQHTAAAVEFLSRAFCYPDADTSPYDELEDAEEEFAQARAQMEHDVQMLWDDHGMSLPVLWCLERSILRCDQAEARLAQAKRGVQIAEGGE